MQEDSPGRRSRARITAEEYNHSLGKLVSTKRRIKPSRKAAIMAAFPVKTSPRIHSDEEGASDLSLKEATVTHRKSKSSTTEVKSTVEVRHELQVFVRGLLLPKTLCLQLYPETSVSALKKMVQDKCGIQPEDQQLYIGRNFQLCDLLSIRDHGIQQDQNIELRIGGLLGGGLEEGQSRNIYFLNLSRKLGPQWEDLAIHLGFSFSEVDTFRANNQRDVEKQSCRMLDAWWKNQDNLEGAPEKLKKALKAIRRVDLALQVQGIAENSFDVEQCARELAVHYRETMRVTTHPMERHMSREMDDIYVNQKLEEETNIPTPFSSSEAKMKAKTGSQSVHAKNTKRGTPDPPKSQPKRDKGFHVQKIPLDSYKHMLEHKSKRLLIRAEAGYGKTTLLKRFAYDWADLKTKGDQTENQQQSEPTSALGKYDLVFVVEVNRMGKKFDIIDAIFSQILTDSKLEKNDLEKYINKNPERVLILLDGADEISLQRVKDTQCKNGIDLNDVLSFKSLKSCKVIVTSRRKTANELLNMHAHYTKINVLGFDKKDRRKYVRKYLTNFEADNQKSFIEKVNGSKKLRSLAEIPLFLWLMCHTWAAEGKLPDQITILLRDNIQLLFQHKAGKQTGEQVSDTLTHISQLGRVALEGLLDPNGEKIYFVEDEIDPKDLEIFERGVDVGLLSIRNISQSLKTVSHFSFPHKTFQEYCAAVYLVYLARTDKEAFDQYLSRLFQSDVESLEYVLRFCCGLDTNVAEVMLRRIGDLLKQNELSKSFHRISMLLLFEAHSESLIKEFLEIGKVAFPIELQGEVLVAAHYFVKVGSKHKILHKVDIKEISAECGGLGDLRLLEDIMTHIQCKPWLNLVLHGISWDRFADNSRGILKYLKVLAVCYCDWNIIKLFQVLSNSSTQGLVLIGINLHDTLSEQNMKSFPSLKECLLVACGLTNSDIEPLFSLLSSAGSINGLVLLGNNLHGLQHVAIGSVPSLEGLGLYESGLTKSDIEPLFSLICSAGRIKTVVLQGNDLHDWQPVKIASVPSLKELHLYGSGLTNGDIETLFSLLSSAGSIKKVILEGNNLHSLRPVKIASVPSLEVLELVETCLTNSDIGPLFYLLSSAGSIKKVVLEGNNLNSLQPVTIARIPSLEELHLYKSGLTNTDIEPLFSLLSSAGSIKTVVLARNNLHDLQPVNIAILPSLEKLEVCKSGLTNSDIQHFFSILSSASSLKKVVLRGNNLHGLQSVTIARVPSLEELHLDKNGLRNDDIEPLFSILSSAGNIKKVVLKGNNFHGLSQFNVDPLPSLCKLDLSRCGLQNSDIRAVFHLLSSLGHVVEFQLNDNNFHGNVFEELAYVPSLELLTP